MDSFDTNSTETPATMTPFTLSSVSPKEPETTSSEIFDNATSSPQLPPPLPINFTFRNILPSGLYLPDDIDREDIEALIRPTATFPSLFNTTLCPDIMTWCPNMNDTQKKIYTDADLWAENNSFARTLIPAMVFVAILMVLGIVGNLLVVYVFGFRFKSATQHFLIVCLACFDLFMSCIAMPSEIADMRFHHTFTSLLACKLLRFITMFSSISSSFTLVTIAIDRHKRVTKPLTKQMTVKRAKMWELINITAALFFSWPLLVLTGLRTSETRIPGLYGTDCSFSDQFHGTKYPLIFNAVLGMGFLVLITVIGILYFRIWKKAKGHRFYMANKSRVSVSVTSTCDARRDARIEMAVSPELPRDMISRTKSDIDLPHERIDTNGSIACDEVGDENIAKHDKENVELNSVASKTCQEGISSNKVKACRSVTEKILSSPGKVNTPSHEKRIRSNDNDLSSVSIEITNNNSKGVPTSESSESYKTKSREVEEGRSNLVSGTTRNTFSSSPISWRKNISPTLSRCSSTSSPVLRTRSFKHQESLCSSIRSNQSLRPMSSLMDSVSKYLLERGTISSHTQSDIVNIYSLKKDVVTNGSVLSISNKSETDTCLSTVPSAASDVCGMSFPGMDDPLTKQTNSAEFLETCKIADMSHSKNISLNNGGVSKVESEDSVDDAMFCRDSSNDFSHLRTSKSKPMDIPDACENLNDNGLQSSKTTEKSSQNKLNVECVGNSQNPTMEKSLSVHYIRRPAELVTASPEIDRRLSSASSSYNNCKRRSTVVSVLERYRIRSGSTTTLDNITIPSTKSKANQSNKMDKTTVVAFAVTSVFVLSFLPYLALMFVRAFVKDFDYNLSDVTLCLYNIFLRFYFLNSAANPLLYGLLNERFRRECKRLLFCRSKRKSDKP